ncbi:DUF4192 domain-containing protein [Isoptericola sp. NPDC056618]|uniref:DUF4192 domain-containing protein n=1 Tax=Isoptericola sp. NPDC056618 TaxID=3345878 RepID=UPI0036952CE8
MDAAYATDRNGEPGIAFDTPLVLRSSRDLLAAVPYLLGFRPRECVVVVAVTDEGRVGLVARTGLADLDGPAGDPGDEVGAGTTGSAAVVARAAARVGARLALVVLYTASPPDRVRAWETAAVGALEQSLGPTVDVETWLVGPDGYRGLDCTDPACCPAGGRPTSELEHGEVGAAFVVAGRAIARSEQEAYRVRALPAGVRDRVAKAAGRAERARAAAGDAISAAPRETSRATPRATPREAAPDGLGRWRTEAYGVWCDLVRQAAAELRTCPAGDVELPPARLGRLAVALADVRVRDAVLLSLVPGAREAADRTVRAGGDVDVPRDVESGTARAIARVVDPRVGVPPDGATADAARLVLEQLVGGAPRRWHAPPLALLGFLAWWRGDGWLAVRRVRESARQDPTYRLAALVAGVLEAAVPPGWVSAARAPAAGARAGATDVAGPTVG